MAVSFYLFGIFINHATIGVWTYRLENIMNRLSALRVEQNIRKQLTFALHHTSHTTTTQQVVIERERERLKTILLVCNCVNYI